MFFERGKDHEQIFEAQKNDYSYSVTSSVLDRIVCFD